MKESFELLALILATTIPFLLFRLYLAWKIRQAKKKLQKVFNEMIQKNLEMADSFDKVSAGLLNMISQIPLEQLKEMQDAEEERQRVRWENEHKN